MFKDCKTLSIEVNIEVNYAEDAMRAGIIKKTMDDRLFMNPSVKFSVDDQKEIEFYRENTPCEMRNVFGKLLVKTAGENYNRIMSDYLEIKKITFGGNTISGERISQDTLFKAFLCWVNAYISVVRIANVITRSSVDNGITNKTPSSVPTFNP